MSEKRRPILVNGELYSKPIEKKSSGRQKEPSISYDDARKNLISDITRSRELVRAMPKESKLPNEVVLCIRMLPEFSAKSYYPKALLDDKTGVTEIGSRVWRNAMFDRNSSETPVNESHVSGKLFFIRATNKGLDAFSQQLDRLSQTKQFELDVRRISSLNLLNPNEQILGIDEAWQEGRLEAVLHPFEIDKNIAIDHFISRLSTAGVDLSRINIKQYGEGVTFLSFLANLQVLENIRGYNPLRTVHPLVMRSFGMMRGGAISGGPHPPIFTKKPSIVVGVLDGGVATGNPYLANYVENVDSVSEPAHADAVSHGTQVSGAVLYGPLNSYTSSDTLPEPLVRVRSFRLFSEQTNDPDLYDVIDAIEEIVPNNPDIDVYNLSIGPLGPILDDSISRFTFSCDRLSREHDKLFCIAVGNDGDRPGYNRIQAPSDMVNGLAVGAYSKYNSPHERAFYSCVGPGREGNKMKPDVAAFGGCDKLPIHLVGERVGLKMWNLGTSFATPIVSSLAGKIIGATNRVVGPLSGRALILHATIEKNNVGHSLELGHGVVPDDFNDIITAPGNGFTLIYKGELEPTKYAEFQIPWINEVTQGNVNIRWTSAVSTSVDQNSPDDYTTSSIVTAFYPDKNKYTFRYGTKTRVLNIASQADEAKDLLTHGWKRDSFPRSDSKQQYLNENDLRQQELKWDTIDSRNLSKRASSLMDPVLHVHAIGRGSSSSKVKFAIILTVEAPKSKVDLYQSILAKFNALVPLRVNIDIPVIIRS